MIGFDCEWGSNLNNDSANRSDWIEALSYDKNDSSSQEWLQERLEKLSLIQIALCDGSVYVLQLRALLQQSINEEPSVYSDNPLGELAELLVDAR